MNLFGSGGTSLPQEVFEQFNDLYIFPSDFHLDFSSQGTSWQATRQNTLAPLPDVPGPSSFQSQASAAPADNDMRNRDVCSKGETGEGLWATSDIHWLIVDPALPPVRLHYPSRYLPSLKQLGRLYHHPCLRPSRFTGSKYHREIMTKDASNGRSNSWNPLLSAWAVVQE